MDCRKYCIYDGLFLGVILLDLSNNIYVCVEMKNIIVVFDLFGEDIVFYKYRFYCIKF